VTLEEDEVDVSTSESDDIIQIYAESEGSRDGSASFPEDYQQVLQPGVAGGPDDPEREGSVTTEDGAIEDGAAGVMSSLTTGVEYSAVDITNLSHSGKMSQSSSNDTLSSVAVDKSAGGAGTQSVSGGGLLGGAGMSEDRLSIRSDDLGGAGGCGGQAGETGPAAVFQFRDGEIGESFVYI